MRKVYGEIGALKEGLKKLQKQGVLELYVFQYDGGIKSKKIPKIAIPSKLYSNDLLSYTTNDLLNFTTNDLALGSDKYDEILKIVGKSNRKDASHIDSAYKSNCKFFFTSDKGDILKNNIALKNLLGIEFFHHNDEKDWEDFILNLK